jgi:hypothetical protein
VTDPNTISSRSMINSMDFQNHAHFPPCITITALHKLSKLAMRFQTRISAPWVGGSGGRSPPQKPPAPAAGFAMAKFRPTGRPPSSATFASRLPVSPWRNSALPVGPPTPPLSFRV